VGLSGGTKSFGLSKEDALCGNKGTMRIKEKLANLCSPVKTMCFVSLHRNTFQTAGLIQGW